MDAEKYDWNFEFAALSLTNSEACRLMYQIMDLVYQMGGQMGGAAHRPLEVPTDEPNQK